MTIYSAANVKNLRLFEPSMLDYEEEGLLLPSIEDISLEIQLELEEDVVLQRKERTKWWGVQDRWLIGLKGQLPTKAKWYSREDVGKKFPHLISP